MLVLMSQLALALSNDTASKKYCYYVTDYVCGENGQTYQNGCIASMAGVNYNQGRCPITTSDDVPLNIWFSIALILGAIYWMAYGDKH